MQQQSLRARAVASLFGLFLPVAAFGQAPLGQAPLPPGPPAAQAPAPEVIATNACGTQLAMPAALPPAGSPPFIWARALFPTQGHMPNVETETYQYYVKLRSSVPSQGIFRTWDEAAEEVARQDFRTLMFDTNFLEDMTVEVTDHVFPNGVVGKMVVYKMEERQRVKIVDYQDDEGKSISIVKRRHRREVRERNIEIARLVLDEAQIRRVRDGRRDLIAERCSPLGRNQGDAGPAAPAGQRHVHVQRCPKIRSPMTPRTRRSARDAAAKIKETSPGILSFITAGHLQSCVEDGRGQVSTITATGYAGRRSSARSAGSRTPRTARPVDQFASR